MNIEKPIYALVHTYTKDFTELGGDFTRIKFKDIVVYSKDKKLLQEHKDCMYEYKMNYVKEAREKIKDIRIKFSEKMNLIKPTGLEFDEALARKPILEKEYLLEIEDCKNSIMKKFPFELPDVDMCYGGFHIEMISLI